jgi:transposase-like protein
MKLMDVMDRFPTEADCIQFLEKRRWPQGVSCLRCQNMKIGVYPSMGKSGKTRKVFQCLTCDYQFTVTTGTIFHDSHLDLRKWFAAIALIKDAKKGISANQVSRHIGVTYKTAWHLCHRIREAMQEESPSKLTGIVEVDEVYIGGRARIYEKSKPKTPVMGAAQRGGEIRLRKVRKGEGVTSADAKKFITEHVNADAEMICTDESQIYPGTISQIGWTPKHQTVKHTDLEFIRGVVYTNTIEGAFGLFKRGIVGTYHQLSYKHLDRYLQEFEYRYNRRKSPDLFEQISNNAVGRHPLPYKKLIAKD